MKKETDPSIRFNNINVGGVQINSGIFIGENSQSLWSAHSKSNDGIGNITDGNIIYKPINIIIDPDGTDGFIYDP